MPVIIFILLLLVINSKADIAYGQTSDEIINEANVGVPVETPTVAPTPTTTPTAAPALTATPSSAPGVTTPTATATAIPTPSPTPAFFPIPIPPPSEIDKLTIFGFGPSLSLIKMAGIAVEESTTADKNGYFEFTGLHFPTALSYQYGNLYPEICLSAIDDEDRVTQAVCIPPLPIKSSSRRIGPVILPPTFSLEKGIFMRSEVSRASGVTTPNTEVEIYLASETRTFDIVREALAYYIPTYQIKSDKDGFFEFTLPTSESYDWRIFSTSNYNSIKSAKSNTLTFKVISPWALFLQGLWYYFKLLRKYLFYVVILAQLVVIALVIRKSHQHAEE